MCDILSPENMSGDNIPVWHHEKEVAVCFQAGGIIAIKQVLFLVYLYSFTVCMQFNSL